MLVGTAVLIADGGTVMSDLATLRDQEELFGSVASDPTLWRTLNEIGPTGRVSDRPGAGEGPGARVGPDQGPARADPAVTGG